MVANHIVFHSCRAVIQLLIHTSISQTLVNLSLLLWRIMDPRLASFYRRCCNEVYFSLLHSQASPPLNLAEALILFIFCRTISRLSDQAIWHYLSTLLLVSFVKDSCYRLRSRSTQIIADLILPRRPPFFSLKSKNLNEFSSLCYFSLDIDHQKTHQLSYHHLCQMFRLGMHPSNINWR